MASGIVVKWAKRELKKHTVFQRDGCHIVHYVLHDDCGSSLLVAVGTQSSEEENMTYSVSAEYLRHFGPNEEANVDTRWRKEQRLDEWLSDLTGRKVPIFGRVQQLKSQSLERIMLSLTSNRDMNELSAQKQSRKFTLGNSDIKWSGKCSEHETLKHYPAFWRGGVKIEVYSFVCIWNVHGKHYLAYILDLFERRDGAKMAEVKYFQIHRGFQNEYSSMDIHISFEEASLLSSTDVQPLQTISCPATVLSLNHFKQCLELLPEALSLQTYVCRNRTITQLPGYSTQPVLASLISHVQGSIKGESSDEAPNVQSHNQPRLSFNVNDKIEVLCQHKSLRECWYKCKILQRSGMQIKVQYNDVTYVKGTNKLEEWIVTHQRAAPDKLGMRNDGRHSVRPSRRSEAATNTNITVGVAVDVWCGNSWWEGVVTRCDMLAQNKCQVFIPAVAGGWIIKTKFLRISQDWINSKWKNVRRRANILEMIMAATSSRMPNTQQLPNMSRVSRLSLAPNVYNLRPPTPTRPGEDIANTSRATDQRAGQKPKHKKGPVVRFNITRR